MNTGIIVNNKFVPKPQKREIKETKENTRVDFKSMMKDVGTGHSTTKVWSAKDKMNQCDKSCQDENPESKPTESEASNETKADVDMSALLGLFMNTALDTKEPTAILNNADVFLNAPVFQTSTAEVPYKALENQTENTVNDNSTQIFKGNKAYGSNQFMQTLQNTVRTAGVPDNTPSLKGSGEVENMDSDFANRNNLSEAEDLKVVKKGLNGEDIVFKLKNLNKDNVGEESIHIKESIKETMKESTNQFAHKDIPAENRLDVVKIKVGDTQVQDKWGALSEKIAKEVIIKANNNNNEFEVQLAPKELGKIHIKILFENGKANVSMMCSNEKTLSLLSEKAKIISGIIESNTGYHSVVNIEKERDSHSQQRNDSYDGRGQKGNQEDTHQQNKRNSRETNMDFIQKIRLGMISQNDMDLV